MKMDIVGHTLFEAMSDDLCPICELVMESIKSAIHSFLYDGVNDPGLRKRIKERLPICR